MNTDPRTPHLLTRCLAHLVFGSVELRHKLRFTNRYLGYVCVVDEEGVIRWHVHSSEIPTEQQIEALRKALIRR